MLPPWAESFALTLHYIHVVNSIDIAKYTLFNLSCVQLLRELVKLMRECWYFTNSARPTALYLKKKVSKLSQDIKVDCDEHE